jgi:hypothetical protein
MASSQLDINMAALEVELDFLLQSPSRSLMHTPLDDHNIFTFDIMDSITPSHPTPSSSSFLNLPSRTRWEIACNTNNGQLMVSVSERNIVLVFGADHDGVLDFSFGGLGSGLGEFRHPTAIAFCPLFLHLCHGPEQPQGPNLQPTWDFPLLLWMATWIQEGATLPSKWNRRLI